MAKLTYTLDNAERACKPVAERLPEFFKPGKRYTLQQIAKTGLHMQNIAWLIAEGVKQEGKGIDVLREWAGRLGKATKLRAVKTETVVDCTDTIARAIKAWAKDRPTSKGGREWAYSVLAGIIDEGKF